MRVTRSRHTGIVIRDVDKMLGFYQEALGLELIARASEGGEEVSAMLGFDNVEVETIKLGNKEHGIFVELLNFVNPELEYLPSKLLNNSGITHIALEVKELDRLYKALVSLNIEFVREPVIVNNYAKVAFCKDPEGNFLELVEVVGE